MIKSTLTSSNEWQPILLSFSITRLQRIVNPIERLMYVFCGLLGIFAILIMPTRAVDFPILWLAAAIGVAILFLVFRGPIVSFYRAVTCDEYINTVEITENDIRCGVGKLEFALPRDVCGVGQGFFGVSVLRTPFGQSIVIPQSSIPTSELKRLLKSNNKSLGFLRSLRLLASRDKKIKKQRNQNHH